MEITEKFLIELEKDTFERLLNYCKEHNLSENQFIKNNLNLIE